MTKKPNWVAYNDLSYANAISSNGEVALPASPAILIKAWKKSQRVCEWRDHKASYFVSPPCNSRQEFIKWYADYFRYCPYCGAKIKRIES